LKEGQTHDQQKTKLFSELMVVKEQFAEVERKNIGCKMELSMHVQYLSTLEEKNKVF